MTTTVLIVDDDPSFAGRIQTLLAGEGYDATAVFDGEAGVQVLARNEPNVDLAIIDLHLPKVNGFDLITNLYRNKRPTRVIATSAVFKPIYVEQTLELGADAALLKTASDEEWVTTARKLLAVAKPQRKGGPAL